MIATLMPSEGFDLTTDAGGKLLGKKRITSRV